MLRHVMPQGAYAIQPNRDAQPCTLNLRFRSMLHQTGENAMSHVFAPAPAVAVPVVGSSDQFPVRRIYCVGWNYEAHAREMGHDPDREPPFFFGKPADAVLYVAPGATGEFPYPSQSKNVHFEMELVAGTRRSCRARRT